MDEVVCLIKVSYELFNLCDVNPIYHNTTKSRSCENSWHLFDIKDKAFAPFFLNIWLVSLSWEKTNSQINKQNLL